MPNLHWSKKHDGNENKPFHSSLLRFLQENQQKLMINCSTSSSTCSLNLLNVTRWHSGIYECVARNIAGTIGRFYEVDVQCKSSVIH